MRFQRLPLDKRAIIEVVLACDPSVAAANAGNPSALMAYRYTDSDPAQLDIPDDATLVRVRPLSKVERDNSAVKAGRMPQRGAQLYQEALQAASAAHAEAIQAANLSGVGAEGAFSVYSETLANRVDALPDADARSVMQFRAWDARRCAEVVRMGVLAVVRGVDESGVEDCIIAGPNGFPVEEFEAETSLYLATAQHAFISARADRFVEAGARLREAMAALDPEERERVAVAVAAGRLSDVPAAVVEALEERAAAERMHWIGATSGAALIEEMAAHVERVSSLGKGGRPCSSTQSGGATATM